MSFRSLAAALCACTLFACGSGLDPSGSSESDLRRCSVNRDCPRGKVCAEHVCRLPCNVNNDCQPGLVCVAHGCRGCKADSECSAGMVCGPSGQCTPGAVGGCTSNNDCGGGQVCVAGNCQSCTSDSQCGAGQVCTNGTCGTPAPQCTNNSGCSNGEVCVGGNCQACTSDSQCNKGQVCVSGACGTPAPQCTSNSGCSSGQVCVGGNCQACTSDSQCSSGQVCTNGACGTPTTNGGCNTMDDCTGGGLCENHACVAMQCLNRATGKTGIRAGFQVTRYVGVIHGANGDHEQLYARITNLLWAHDPSIVVTGAEMQVDMNISSSTDASGLPREIPLAAGAAFEAEGEYIDPALATGTGGEAVVHFTHSTCGYVTINGTTYQ